LRFISCCHKSHTLYRLSYPGKGFIDEVVVSRAVYEG
jgi:hypothetical protein